MKRMFALSLVLGLLALGLAACGGSSNGSCSADGGVAEAKLNLTLKPSSAAADDTTAVVAFLTGTDAKCHTLPTGTSINVSLTDPSTAGVGQFKDGTTDTVVATTDLGARVNIFSSTPGTVMVNAYYTDTTTTPSKMINALPAKATFTTPVLHGQCAVTLSSSHPAILADGNATTIITATLINDTGGTMPDNTVVTFTTDLGQFTESSAKNYAAKTQTSVATATLKSELLTADKTATVTAVFKCDNSSHDSKSNTIRIPFVLDIGKPRIMLTAAKTEVLADGTSTVGLTADLFLAGGNKAGAGETVTFFTNMGTFIESNTASYDATTDANGEATATFLGGSTGGVAHIRASAYIDSQNIFDTADINVLQLGFIEWVSSVPNKIGVKGSGVNESSVITFAVYDTNHKPFNSGTEVDFSTSQASGATVEPDKVNTDASGIVMTTLKSGYTATTVVVTATAKVGKVQMSAPSDGIAIVGAKPNARYMTFNCERKNVGGFAVDFVNTKCTIALGDRFSNKIGISTKVTFRTEAGTIDSEASTSELTSDLGMATVTAQTQHMALPADVTPMPGEPSIQDGAYTRNPRDGLVVLIASTTGEEEFEDINGNGQYDAGEPFVDLGEPFLDLNDNGVWDSGEPFMDANNNGHYDGPNDQWDKDTLIWAPTWMVWTGDVVFEPGGGCPALTGTQARYSTICGENLFQPGVFDQETFDIAKGSFMKMHYEIKDLNLNPLNASINISGQVNGKGNLGASTPPLPITPGDSLGIGVSWVKVSDVFTMAPCNFPTDTVCYYAPALSFAAASETGWSGTVVINGADITDVKPPAAGTVSIKANYQEGPGGTGQAKSDSVSISGTFE